MRMNEFSALVFFIASLVISRLSRIFPIEDWLFAGFTVSRYYPFRCHQMCFQLIALLCRM